MFQMEVSRVINSLVDTLIGKDAGVSAPPGKGLLFQLELGLASHTKEGSFMFREHLHLLYNKKKGGSYISVFSHVGRVALDLRVRQYDWKHEVTHDSCWRDLSLMNTLYFQLAEQVNEKRSEVGLEKIAPILMSNHTNFSLFQPAFKWVDVEQTTLPGDGPGRQYAIKIL